jgi:hypothetical protein
MFSFLVDKRLLTTHLHNLVLSGLGLYFGGMLPEIELNVKVF